MGGSFPLVETNEDGTHVVHAVLVAAVPGHQFIEEFFNDFLTADLLFDASLNPLDHLTIALYLPDTITSHNNKIYGVCPYLYNVGAHCDHLLLRFQPRLFVL